MKAGGVFCRKSSDAPTDASSFLSETLTGASLSTSRAGVVRDTTGSAGRTGLPKEIAPVAFRIVQCQGTSLGGTRFPSKLACAV